jgi:hypothetical protein
MAGCFGIGAAPNGGQLFEVGARRTRPIQDIAARLAKIAIATKPICIGLPDNPTERSPESKALRRTHVALP